MPVVTKAVVFILTAIGIACVSRSSLRDVQCHGFYRFLAWETILLLFLVNMGYWFADPFSLRQIVSWIFLILSLVLIIEGVRLLRQQGKLDQDRCDQGLVGIEKTTELVTTGIYHYIRHPLYASLLYLAWGAYLKEISWISTVLMVLASASLLATAKADEKECIQYFGSEYEEYMQRTKMFIPFVF